MASVLRLVWKQYRFELAAVVFALGSLAVVSFVVAWLVDAARPTDACLDAWLGPGRGDAEGCDVRSWLRYRQSYAARLSGFLAIIPFVAGALLGSVLVSREVEHRTAQLGWSLSGSRRRWLAERVVPVGALLLLLLAVLAVAGEVLLGATDPGVPTRSSLDQYGLRGLPIVARGLAAFAVAVLVGAIAGRQLPAIVVSAMLTVALGLAVWTAMPFGAPVEWVDVDPSAEEPSTGFASLSEPDLTIGYGYRAQDGSIVTWEEAFAQAPFDPGSAKAFDWVNERFTEATGVLRGPMVTEVEMREALLLGAIAVLALGGSFAVVGRRRPY